MGRPMNAELNSASLVQMHTKPSRSCKCRIVGTVHSDFSACLWGHGLQAMETSLETWHEALWDVRKC
jgi:hypothetical protein